ncbi:lysophospholipid transporter LplT [Betaproteobacteria bacterium]|nr:lysophospholipid transporter LplT [Betaproteobacteria bacterium]GHT98915.1 lysophospholipid transporter LplT [Betaproteobacteria bacterium]GHU07045.1 lysophospholipid transporter LplT [Betaproteobacteria bacterium]GHU21545.1 lysophospholipid transporter LplT [Betaproteobacteria bacterium]GHU27709.1 lysophospholipid transporter LplT [Betaproteobacteria bacterium]
MPFGFYIIMAAQFFSALADNALLIVAIAMLRHLDAPDAADPMLKMFFAISYVVLAAFVGAFADSMAKWRVMLISNTIKIGGCLMLFLGIHPLVSYAVIGFGAAAYSPAKYGILTEYLPHRLLVVANGWIEGLTMGAIILGTVLGGILVDAKVADWMTAFELPLLHTSDQYSIFAISFLYIFAAAFNLFIPDTGVDHKPLKSNPLYLVRDFNHCLKLLWRDKLGQISLAVTTLVWGASSTLQFIVIKWAEYNLNLELSKASMLQGVVAIGMAAGAILAAKFVSLRQSVSVIPLGIVLGLVILLMPFVTNTTLAMVLMVVIGCLGGAFVVPMNALLQHRGHVLMGAGHSIAVQNFNENISILLMTGIYALLIFLGLSIHTLIILFGLFLAGTMYVAKRWHEANQRHMETASRLDDLP